MRPLILNPLHLQQFHARAIVSGLISDPFIAGNLIESHIIVYPAALASAAALLSAVPNRSTFIYNTLIAAHASCRHPAAAASSFFQMLLEGHRPNRHTFPPVLKALSHLRDLKTGETLHSMIRKLGLCSDDFVHATLVHFYGVCGRTEAARRAFDGVREPKVSAWTALLSGYVKSGDLEAAREVFDEMPVRNEVSWGAMISGYVQCGDPMQALMLFRKMSGSKVLPSSPVLVSVLTAIAELGALREGKWVHAYLERGGVNWSHNLKTSLVHMYMKCGDVEGAREVFDKMADRGVDVWNAMITGLGLHGNGKEALELFEDMVFEGLKPDDMTFIGVLCGCSHAGLVSEGLACFDKMSRVHNISPKIEHYSCMVDLLARAGLLVEAMELIDWMPMEPNVRVWGSLFGACRIQQDTELGEIIGKHLIKLEPHKAGHYVLLANLFASRGRWRDAVNVRESMKQSGIELEPGCSLIEVDGVVHEFLVGDRIHPGTRDIYDMLNGIAKLLSGSGQFPRT